MADIPFKAIHRAFAQSAQGQCLTLHGIVVCGPRSMGIDKTDLFAGHLGFGKGLFHSIMQPATGTGWPRNMVGIVGNGSTFEQYGRQLRPAGIRGQHHCADRLSERQTMLFGGIVWTAGTRADRFEREEPFGHKRRNQIASHHNGMATHPLPDHASGHNERRDSRDAGIRDYNRLSYCFKISGYAFCQTV